MRKNVLSYFGHIFEKDNKSKMSYPFSLIFEFYKKDL